VERWLVIAAMLLLIGALLLFLGNLESSQGPQVTLLNENLAVMGYAEFPPQEYNGRTLVGRLGDAYVYAPTEGLYEPKFVDRLAFLIGREVPADVPVEWWMEKYGYRIEPVGERSSLSFTLVVKTPYEVIRTELPVVPLYTGWHLGKEFEANGDCIVVKEDGERTVPLLLEGRAVLDPDARVVCRPCRDFFVEVNGEGYYSIGDGTRYFFFGEFNGGFWVCDGDWVKVYVDGFRPWSGKVEENLSLKLEPLSTWKELDGNGVFIDSTGALASIGPARVPVGAYHEYSVFPFHRKGFGLEVVELPEPAWLGYKEVSSAPLYSFVRVGESYHYVLAGGLVPAEGLICKGSFCIPSGGEVPVVAFGNCELLWDGELRSDCPPLKVNIKSSE